MQGAEELLLDERRVAYRYELDELRHAYTEWSLTHRARHLDYVAIVSVVSMVVAVAAFYVQPNRDFSGYIVPGMIWLLAWLNLAVASCTHYPRWEDFHRDIPSRVKARLDESRHTVMQAKTSRLERDMAGPRY